MISVRWRPSSWMQFSSDRVTVWCAVASFGIIGHHFFEESGDTVTINSARCIEMIKKLSAARTAPKKNKLCQCVVSTRWCHSAHCKRVDDHFWKHVSQTTHFPFRRRAVAPSLSRSFNVWFFPLGVFEIACLHSQTPYVRWMIWRKPSVRKFVRSIVSCRPVSWTIIKQKAWKLHPRRRSAPYRYHFKT